jgi:hypothetical protein
MLNNILGQEAKDDPPSIEQPKLPPPHNRWQKYYILGLEQVIWFTKPIRICTQDLKEAAQLPEVTCNIGTSLTEMKGKV